MKYAVSCSLMKKLDQDTIENKGVPSLVLMERAALKTAEEMEMVLGKKGKKETHRILCVCGSGNNGGDGIAVARILFLHGYPSEIYLAGNPDHMTRETAAQLKIASNYHIPVVNNPQFSEYTTIVDALFGIGLARPAEGFYAELIHKMNRSDAWKVAVDIPSGVNGDTGAVMGTAFEADLTVTFAFRKTGLCLYPGRRLAGRIVVADIGICKETSLMEERWYFQKDDLCLLPKRNQEGNKGTFGKVLAVTGSAGMCGAAYLSSAAAFGCGAGMVKILTEDENRVPLQTRLPEAMTECREDEKSFQEAFDWCDVLLAGPGLGMSEKSRKKVKWCLEKAGKTGKQMILDADGLNLLTRNPEWKKYLGPHVVLTPHLGEMSHLTGISIPDIQADREKAACQYAAHTGAVCVLKDASTVIAGPDGTVWLNLSGNPGMASAGSGDVLTGILAGLFCMYRNRTLTAKEKTQIAALGVFIHGKAGDLAVQKTGEYGMKAGDLIPAVSRVIEYGGNYEKI